MNFRHLSARAGATIIPVTAAALVGQRATKPNLEPWYRPLAKPSFTPPEWVFGPVWISLYVLMIVGGWRILRSPRRTPGRSSALALYYAQLVLNAAWPTMFFGWHSPRAGLVNIVLQEGAIVAAIERFRRADPVAATCLIPLASWVAFAAFLNFAIWRRND